MIDWIKNLFCDENTMKEVSEINKTVIPITTLKTLYMSSIIKLYLKEGSDGIEMSSIWFPISHGEEVIEYFQHPFTVNEDSLPIVLCKDINDMLLNENGKSIIIDSQGNIAPSSVSKWGGKIPLYADIRQAILTNEHAPQGLKDDILIDSFNRKFNEYKNKTRHVKSFSNGAPELDLDEKSFMTSEETLKRLLIILAEGYNQSDNRKQIFILKEGNDDDTPTYLVVDQKIDQQTIKDYITKTNELWQWLRINDEREWLEIFEEILNASGISYHITTSEITITI